MPICSASEPIPVSRRGLLGGLAALAALPGRASFPTALPVSEVAPNLYVYQAPFTEATRDNLGAIANLAFIVGTKAVAVIDSGGSLAAGQALLASIRRVTPLPVGFVVHTHFHPDHLFGDSAFPGARIVAHHNLAGALAARRDFYLETLRRELPELAAGSALLPPDLLVADQLTLDLGRRPLLLQAWPTAHSDSDLSLRDLTSDSWFLGDLLFVRRMPTIDGSLRGWIRLLHRLQAMPAARAIPGHGPASVVWPGGAEALSSYLNGLAAAVRQAVADGMTLAQAQDRVGGDLKDDWLLFDEIHPRNVAIAFAELEWE